MDDPLPLDDQQELAQILLAGFGGRDGVDQLNQLVRPAMDGFDIFVQLGGGTIALADVVTPLIQAAEANGRTTAMVQALLLARKGDTRLRTWVSRCRPALLALVPDADYQKAQQDLIASASDGLDALKQLAAVRADIRATLDAAHIDLAAVPQQINRLAQYKGLHDVLHKVQVPLYRSILQEMKGFPTDAACADALMDYATQLTVLAADAQSVIDQTLLDPAAIMIEAGWITSLASTADLMGKGAMAGDRTVVFAQAIALKALLRAQPPRLDALLVMAARSIPFQKLIETMKAIGEALPDGARRQALDGAVLALVQLDDDVTMRVAEHESWQQIEASFWITEEAIQRDDEMSLMEFSAVWSALEQQIGQVCTRSPGDWVSSLQTSAQAFLTACPQPAMPPVAADARMAFARYVSVGRLRFYLLDKDLKARCDKVSGLSRPLAELIDGVRL